MVHNYSAKTDKIIIRPLKHEDIESLRNWRNDSALSHFLTSIPYITEEMQDAWFLNYLCEPNIYQFGIIDADTKQLIGSVAIYGIKNSSCEIGKIVIGNPSMHGKGIGYGSLLLAMEVAIKCLNIRTITLNVHENNKPALTIYQKAGFQRTGKHLFEKGGYELEMKIESHQFYNKNATAIDEIEIYVGDVQL